MLAHRRLNLFSTSALVGALAFACNHTPIENLEKSFTMKVQVDTRDDEPVKVDFLWVVDNSTSMCQEQVSLARSFGTFTQRLQESFDIDARIAVTTSDVQCAPSASVNSAKGTFNRRAAMVFDTSCQESRIHACSANSDCAGLDCSLLGSCGADQGEWLCSPSTILAECVTNPNESINTRCTRRCLADAECQALFGDPAYYCNRPASGPGGCLRPPATSGCPTDIGEPGWLTNDNLDNFRCIATVGTASGSSCLRYEQPLMAGLLALDPTGPNSAQALAFLRPDAYLVVVFISDEEDCSVPYDYATNQEDSRFRLGEGNFNRCGLLKTTDEGGPLVPVAHFVNKLKSLKRDPGRVIVAAIAGDSLETTPESVALDRQDYIASKSAARDCHQQTTICRSSNGVADFGARFLQLTQAFGPNGSFANICADEGIGPALDQVANTIVAVINKVCLPRPILNGLIVRRIRGGVATQLTQGQGRDTFDVIFGSEDCLVDGVIMPAIVFGDPPIPGEEIEIEYQGDPGFD
jgi:hypothetical protein